MHFNTAARVALVVFSSAIITGCEGTKRILGLERQHPDEFNVMRPAPLSMPPRFDELPTPQPGVQRPQEQSPQEKARRAVTGDIASPTTETDEASAEEALLKRAGADATASSIRDTVDKEAQTETNNEASFVRKIVSAKKKKPGKTLNPREEYKRIYGKDHPSSKVEDAHKLENRE